MNEKTQHLKEWRERKNTDIFNWHKHAEKKWVKSIKARGRYTM